MHTTQGRIGNIIAVELARTFDSKRVECAIDVPLKKFSTFNIGGNCSLAVFPKNKNELMLALDLAHRSFVPCVVIGKGSNVLFSDKGYGGIMIFTSHMRQICACSDGAIRAAAGANLTAVSVKAYKLGLSGLEFACGIPGSCGGAVYMNAGAYGGEISDVLEYSEYYDADKKRLVRLSNAEHEFSYRSSIYSNDPNMIITEVGFRLVRDNMADIKSKMDEYTEKRRSTQPHEYPNAGSIFKRPSAGFAAKMIDECGLKGLSVGDAKVSEKHAGFIVNVGNATAADVLALIEIIKERVYEKFGVVLECEIKYVE